MNVEDAYNTKWDMDLTHQMEDDEKIARRIAELKPKDCECYVDLEVDEWANEVKVELEHRYYCPVHYPMTSIMLRALEGRGHLK